MVIRLSRLSRGDGWCARSTSQSLARPSDYWLTEGRAALSSEKIYIQTLRLQRVRMVAAKAGSSVFTLLHE